MGLFTRETTADGRLDEISAITAPAGHRREAARHPLARNTPFSLVWQILPIPVALASVPVVVEQSGTVQFGIFSLVWVVLGPFLLLDFWLIHVVTHETVHLRWHRYS